MGSSQATTCLVTGATGFLGRHIVRELQGDGHVVWSLSRSPAPSPMSIAADLAAGPPALPPIDLESIYHVAGAAHRQPRTAADAAVFEHVNVQGLRNLLAAADRHCGFPRSLVLVSSVAVYGRSQGDLLDENTIRQAQDPYGASKRIAEDVAIEWAEARGVRLALIRLPLVVGRGAPGNWARLVESLRRSRYFGIGEGEARRSMVLAEDVAAALPLAATAGGIFHFTDGAHPSFREIETAVVVALGVKQPWRLSRRSANALAALGDAVRRLGLPSPFYGDILRKLTSTLTFSDQRAREVLGWRPRPVLDQVSRLLLEPQ